MHIPAYLVRPGDVIRTEHGDSEIVAVEQGRRDLPTQLRIHLANQEPLLRHVDATVPVVDVF